MLRMSGTLSFILQMNFTGSRSQSMFRAVQIGCIKSFRPF